MFCGDKIDQKKGKQQLISINPYRSSQPSSNKSLPSLPTADKRLSVISITMASIAGEVFEKRRQAKTQDMIDRSGFSSDFLDSKGR